MALRNPILMTTFVSDRRSSMKISQNPTSLTTPTSPIADPRKAHVKSEDALRQEWERLPKDWYRVYQSESLKAASYSEKYFARWILEEFDGIALNTGDLRKAGFKVSDHHGQAQVQAQTQGLDMTEKRLVRALFNAARLPPLGSMLDYEVPLKGTEAAPHGDIDLLTHDASSLLLIEAKQGGSSESLLKAALQAYTYSSLVAHVKARFVGCYGMGESVKLTPAVLTFGTAASGKQLAELDRQPNTRALILRLNQELAAKSLSGMRFFVCGDDLATCARCLTTAACGKGWPKIMFREGFSPSICEVKI